MPHFCPTAICDVLTTFSWGRTYSAFFRAFRPRASLSIVLTCLIDLAQQIFTFTSRLMQTIRIYPKPTTNRFRILAAAFNLTYSEEGVVCSKNTNELIAESDGDFWLGWNPMRIHAFNSVEDAILLSLRSGFGK